MPFSFFKTQYMIMYCLTFFLIMSSKSMFFMWVFMEMNLIFYLSLMPLTNISSSNSYMKYFLIQMISSNLFLLAIFMSTNFLSNFYNMIMIMAMWIKMGFFPFTSWYFQMAENLDWKMWFLLNTGQKFMPLLIISFHFNFQYLVNFLIISNILYALIEIWHQTSIRWMINCSSINHFMWMIFSFNSMESYWTIYFLMIYLY